MTLPRPAPLFGTPPAPPGRPHPAGTGVLGVAVTTATRTRGRPAAPLPAPLPAASPAPRRPSPSPVPRPLSGVERDRAVLLGFDASGTATLLTAARHQRLDTSRRGLVPRAPWWRRLLRTTTSRSDPAGHR